MYKELITSNGHTFSFNILGINFSILDQPLVSLEHSTAQKCYLRENKVKGKAKVSNISVAGIYTIKICGENLET